MKRHKAGKKENPVFWRGTTALTAICVCVVMLQAHCLAQDGQERFVPSGSSKIVTISPGKEPLVPISFSNMAKDKFVTYQNLSFFTGVSANDIKMIRLVVKSLGFDANSKLGFYNSKSFKGKSGEYVVINPGVGEFGNGKIVIDNKNKTYDISLMIRNGKAQVSVGGALNTNSNTKDRGKILTIKAEGQAWYLGKILKGLGNTKDPTGFSEVLKQVVNKEAAMKTFMQMKNNEFVVVILEKVQNGTYEVTKIMNKERVNLLAKNGKEVGR